jgi:hypothetical protein
MLSVHSGQRLVINLERLVFKFEIVISREGTSALFAAEVGKSSNNFVVGVEERQYRPDHQLNKKAMQAVDPSSHEPLS